MGEGIRSAGTEYARLQMRFEPSPEAIILHDANEYILPVNQQAIDTLGFDSDKLNSMTVDEIVVA